MSTNSSVYMREYTNRKQRQVINDLGGRCLICASVDFLEVHHIFGYDGDHKQGRGKRARVFEWLKNMDRICLLCNQHHVEYHRFCRGEINEDTLLDYILFKFIENEEMRFI